MYSPLEIFYLLCDRNITTILIKAGAAMENRKKRNKSNENETAGDNQRLQSGIRERSTAARRVTRYTHG